MSRISVRKYQRGNQKCTIQRNWHHRVRKTKKNKVKHHTKITAWKALSFVATHVVSTLHHRFHLINKALTHTRGEHTTPPIPSD